MRDLDDRVPACDGPPRSGGRKMDKVLTLPFTCRGCQENFSLSKDEADRNAPIKCPKCDRVYKLRQEQMKQLAPGRKPVRE